MASNGRRKIDAYTQQMFDIEVDKPAHDEVLVNLFNDSGTLARLLYELHGLSPLPPIEQYEKFEVFDTEYGHRLAPVSFAEAKAKSKVAPTWKSPSPLRIVGKQLECLMNYTAEENRGTRVMGFVDIGVFYEVVQRPSLTQFKGSYSWQREAKRHLALIEVKSEWPTAGNLIRQLNLYRSCRPRMSDGSSERTYLLVGPDDSMNALANEHHYRLVTFREQGKVFSLEPRVWFPPEKEPPNQF